LPLPRPLKKILAEGVYPGVFLERVANAGLISARVKKCAKSERVMLKRKDIE
jgi:hypothetical protein